MFFMPPRTAAQIENELPLIILYLEFRSNSKSFVKFDEIKFIFALSLQKMLLAYSMSSVTTLNLSTLYFCLK